MLQYCREKRAQMIDSSVKIRETGHNVEWDVPRSCHTYLVQTVLAPKELSPRASFMSRSVRFFCGLLTSHSQEVTVVALLAARDLRSSLGSNLALVQEVAKLDPWAASRAELQAALVPVPQLDSWKVPTLEKLLSARLQAYYLGDKEEEKRLQALISSLVTN